MDIDKGCLVTISVHLGLWEDGGRGHQGQRKFAEDILVSVLLEGKPGDGGLPWDHLDLSPLLVR